MVNMQSFSNGNLDPEITLKLMSKLATTNEQELGPEHPDTAASYNNIGMVHKALGNYQRALEFHKKALQTHLQTLGTEHQNTATLQQYRWVTKNSETTKGRVFKRCKSDRKPRHRTPEYSIFLQRYRYGAHPLTTKTHQFPRESAMTHLQTLAEHQNTATSNNIGGVQRTWELPRALGSQA